MKELKKQYAVLIADKAASTYVIHCKAHLAKQVMEEINTNETYKHIVDTTIKEVQDRHAELMMQENPAEPQDDEDPNVIHIPDYSKVIFQTAKVWSLNQTPQAKQTSVHGMLPPGNFNSTW